MKTFIALIIGAGLVSAASQAAEVAEGSAVNVNNNSNNNSSAVVNGSEVAPGVDINNGNFDPANLNLGNMNVNGLDLGSIDLSNQNDIINAIGLMMNSLCLGNQFNSNNLFNLGRGQDLQLFLELAQLMQLQQLGFLNVFDIQNIFNAGNLFGGFNFGGFKRAADDRKKTLTRTKLRRGTLTRRQLCSAVGVDPNAPNAGVAPPPPAAAPPAAVAPPQQAAPVQAAPSAAPANNEKEDLSDFTR